MASNQALRDELWDIGLRVEMLDMAMDRRRRKLSISFQESKFMLFSVTIRNMNQLEPSYTINNAPSIQERYSNYGVINNYIRNVMPCKFFSLCES